MIDETYIHLNTNKICDKYDKYYHWFYVHKYLINAISHINIYKMLRGRYIDGFKGFCMANFIDILRIKNI